jgi:hypothetical protein
MVKNEDFRGALERRSHDYRVEHDENGNEILFSRSVRLIVKPTQRENARIRISRSARGLTEDDARQRSRGITYNYAFKNNVLKLDGYFLFDKDDKYNNQQVEIELFLPEGAIIYPHKNTESFHRNYSDSGDILPRNSAEYYHQVVDEELQCLDCPPSKSKNRKNRKNNQRDITINSEKVDINIKNKDKEVNLNVLRDSVPTDTNN